MYACVHFARRRLIPRLQAELVGVAEAMLNSKNEISDLAGNYELQFSGFEPAVNRYEAGGAFEPHQDEFSITVNILLSDEGSFRGGGTAFYSQQADDKMADAPAVKIEPDQGCAVVFNGSVWHEGLPVEKGVRHLYVASFDLVPVQ